MPSYMCGSTRISLSVADLAKSTTASAIHKVGPEAALLIQNVANELKKDIAERTLPEIPILTEEQWPSHLRFIGANQDMPFLMVQAGKDLFNPISSRRSSQVLSVSSTVEQTHDGGSPQSSDTSFSSLTTLESTTEVSPEDEISLLIPSDVQADGIKSQSPVQVAGGVQKPVVHSEDRTKASSSESIALNTSSVITSPCQTKEPELRRSSVPSARLVPDRRPTFCPEMKPQALCLTVQLSKKSFLRKRKSKPLDVKIDIYFNGGLCASAYVPERMCSESNVADLTQRFAGRRIERLLERPWIIIPPGQTPAGTLREHKRSKKGGYSGALHRWTAINELLREEAEKEGRNRWGDLSVLGDYLDSLSRLKMPKEVEDLQKAGGPKFGVLDVVLTTGHGKKYEPDYGYLSEPAPMKTSEFKIPKQTLGRTSPSRLAGSHTHKPRVAQRPKTSADAEIIANGLSYLTPHESCVPESAQGQRSEHSDMGGIVSVSTRGGNFQPPDIPSTAPSAVRRRQSGSIRTSGTTPTSSQSANVMDEDSLIPFGSTPQASPQDTLVVPTSSGSWTAAQSPTPVPLRHRLAMPASNIPALKRGTTNFPLTPHPPSSSLPGSNGRSHSITKDTNNRAHSPGCRFTKRSTPSKPANIPQKRYKGSDATASAEDEELERQRKRSRMHGELVLTNKMTLAEEIAAIQEQAREELLPAQSHTTTTTNEPGCRRSSSEQIGRRSQSCAPNNLAPRTKVIVLRLSAARLATFVKRPTGPGAEFTSTSPPISLHAPPSVSSAASLSAPLSTPRNTSTPKSKPLPKTPRSRIPPASRATYVPSTWRPPPLNEDCVITYAPDAIRQVKAERSGWFKEVGVLVGVRFLIG